MHIAFWSPAWPLEKFHNGIVTYVHWMKRELESREHRVSVFTAGAHELTDNGHIHRVRSCLRDRVVRRLSGMRRPMEYNVFDDGAIIGAAILQVHRRNPIDVIEMEESFGWFADVAKRTSLPVLVKLHGPAFLSLVEEELNTFGREKIEREGQALRRARTIISPSKLTLMQTIQRYGLTPKEQRHIVNPVTMERDTPTWNIDGCDRETILCVGRFDLRKGADVLLKTFRSLVESRPNVKLIFVGPDSGLQMPNGNRVHFEAYRDSLFPPDLRNCVDFRGPMSNREIAKLRTQAMMTVIASRWENQGYAVLEAMFQGCPVVSTDAGGCPESIVHGVTGRLARSEQPADFAAQICAMLDDPQAAAAMGQAARRYVIEEHSATRVAALSLELYDRVISARD
jgi:glycosyltransferase involved in cell wall biosynthesis